MDLSTANNVDRNPLNDCDTPRIFLTALWIMLGVVFLGGCVQSGLHKLCRVQHDSDEVVVVTRESVFGVKRNAEGNWVIGEPHVLLNPAVSAAGDGEYVWVLTERGILRLDHQLAVDTRLSFQGKGVLPFTTGFFTAPASFGIVRVQTTTDPDSSYVVRPPPFPFFQQGDIDAADGYAYVGVGQRFLVIGPDGEVVSKTGLQVNPHDILVHGTEAFVLGRAANQTMLYRIDITNRRAPRVIEARKIENATAWVQWVDENAASWAVVLHRGRYIGGLEEALRGEELSLHLASLRDGKDRIETLWDKRTIGEKMNELLSGRHKLGNLKPESSIWPLGSEPWRVTKSWPVWALLAIAEKVKVVRLGAEDNAAVITASWAPPKKVSDMSMSAIASSGLFLYVGLDRVLYVLDVSKEKTPELVASVALPDPPVEIVVRRFSGRKSSMVQKRKR